MLLRYCRTNTYTASYYNPLRLITHPSCLIYPLAQHIALTPVIAFEERIFDAVIEDLQTREPTEEFRPMHVICLDTKDNPMEAKKQGRIALELCWLLEQADDLITEAPEILDAFQEQRMTHTPIKVLYQLCYL